MDGLWEWISQSQEDRKKPSAQEQDRAGEGRWAVNHWTLLQYFGDPLRLVLYDASVADQGRLGENR